MIANASPTAAGVRFARTAAVLAALVLVAGLASAYQVGVRARRAPSFTVGGTFADPADFPYPGVDGRGYPYGNAQDAAAGSAAEAPATTLATALTATAPPAARPAAAADEAPGSATAAGTTAPHPPALGTYTYAVSGTEGATGFGSRSYPGRATVVVHGGPGARADELVHDLRLSEQHEEREVVRYGPTGIAFSFEGGAITFGPGTQTSQATYDPLMVQIPFPLRAGASASAASAARNGDKVDRTEQWTATVVGQEVLDVLGAKHMTWVVDLQRNTEPGGREVVDRFRRYWYDPVLGTWVKWTERFHASRDMLVDFTYDTTYTATLVGFASR
jgi:hypothetical protein